MRAKARSFSGRSRLRIEARKKVRRAKWNPEMASRWARPTAPKW